MAEEIIIWKGQPRYKARVAIIEIFGGGWGIFAMLLTLIFMSILFFTGFCFITGDYKTGIISGALFLSIIFVPEILKRIRRSNTRYTVTNKKVKFELWWWGERSVHEVPLENINRFYYVEFKDKYGHIHLILKKPQDFRTRNFWSGLQRQTLSFEDIPDVIELSKMLNLALKKYH